MQSTIVRLFGLLLFVLQLINVAQGSIIIVEDAKGNEYIKSQTAIHNRYVLRMHIKYISYPYQTIDIDI